MQGTSGPEHTLRTQEGRRSRGAPSGRPSPATVPALAGPRLASAGGSKITRSLGPSQVSRKDTRTSAGTRPSTGTRARSVDPGTEGRPKRCDKWCQSREGTLAKPWNNCSGKRLASLCSPAACGTGRLARFGGPGGTRPEAVRRPRVPALHDRERRACWALLYRRTLPAAPG